MNKRQTLTTLAALCVASISFANPAGENSSPFMDNLTVKLKGFNNTVDVRYAGNNGVNISGPTKVMAGTTAIPVSISSQNMLDNGFPAMTVTTADHAHCQLNFVDGPWTILNYKTDAPPSCSHIKVSSITSSSQYRYALTLTYQ